MIGRRSASTTPGLVTVELGSSTTYLLSCRGGDLQVDTGYGWTYPDDRRALSRRGIELDEIDWLLLTHHRDDHAGFLNAASVDLGSRRPRLPVSVGLLDGPEPAHTAWTDRRRTERL